jgi:drug/metabolite transporter (DMT)-like permease
VSPPGGFYFVLKIWRRARSSSKSSGFAARILYKYCMDPIIFAAVLFAAACHAGWNAVLKIRIDPFATTTLIVVASGVIALPFIPVFGLPGVAAWPWLVASVVWHLGYFYGLSEAYRTGDMGQVYPIARGAAPLMTALIATFFFGEHVDALAWIGILILVSGVFLLSARGGRVLQGIDRRALGFAFFTAVTICGYTIADGTGARVSTSPHAYAAAIFAGNGLAMALFALCRRGPGLFVVAAPHWKIGLAGGAMSLAAYWIVIWAMSIAPIAIVAALREASVLFGAAIAVLLLKEPLRAVRMLAAIMILGGLVLIRLQ